MPTYTYTFGNNLGSITVTTAANTSQVTTDASGDAYTGYAVTNVTGTFDGYAVNGYFGTSGAYQDTSASGDSGDDIHDNAIFINSSQGVDGSSDDGIDDDGIDFNLSNGDHVNLFTNASSGSSDFSYGIFTSNETNTDGEGNYSDATLTQTNYTPTCYASGTLIRILREGRETDVAVEALVVGDMAVTAGGERRPIRWIGHQTHRLTGPAQPRSLWPVRVAAHAFGENRPDRDLLLSPGHSLCVGLIYEAFVPVQELVNGSTVAYVEDASEVTYWHVELDTHDVLLANNMPAESFLEMGANRATFIEGRGLGDPSAEVVGRTHADFCCRFVDRGPLIDLLREELALRAVDLGWQPSHEVEIGCTADGKAIRGRTRGGEALFVLPEQPRELRLATTLVQPSLRGEADPRRLGVAVYKLAITDADGAERALDLDGPALAPCFHAGERAEGLHYRWNAGDIVVPASLTAGLACPLLLELRYEPSTVRGWREPEHRPQKPVLRVVG